jgi:NADH-quinone oxidoreductase subunit C
MTRAEVLADIRERFGADTIELFDKSPRRVYLQIRPEAIVRVATYLFRTLGARFNIASGTDLRDTIEILYHFIIEDLNLLISLRVKLDHEKPEIASLARDIEALNWIERELMELLGITFTGHPEPKRLLLADNWPEGVYPLRQCYVEWDETADRTRGV